MTTRWISLHWNKMESDRVSVMDYLYDLPVVLDTFCLSFILHFKRSHLTWWCCSCWLDVMKAATGCDNGELLISLCYKPHLERLAVGVVEGKHFKITDATDSLPGRPMLQVIPYHKWLPIRSVTSDSISQVILYQVTYKWFIFHHKWFSTMQVSYKWFHITSSQVIPHNKWFSSRSVTSDSLSQVITYQVGYKWFLITRNSLPGQLQVIPYHKLTSDSSSLSDSLPGQLGLQVTLHKRTSNESGAIYKWYTHEDMWKCNKSTSIELQTLNT